MIKAELSGAYFQVRVCEIMSVLTEFAEPRLLLWTLLVGLSFQSLRSRVRTAWLAKSK